MASGTQLPLADYLSTSCRPDCEYIDGVLLERDLGEYDHSRLLARLIAYVMRHERDWGIHAVVSQRSGQT